jgi:hypothetical protein
MMLPCRASVGDIEADSGSWGKRFTTAKNIHAVGSDAKECTRTFKKEDQTCAGRRYGPFLIAIRLGK